MFLQIYLIIVLYIYIYIYITNILVPVSLFCLVLPKTPHTTPQDHTSPTDPTRTQPYSTCCPTPFHNNRAHTIHTWERIHTSLKLSSTYNQSHLVSDGLPRYSSQLLPPHIHHIISILKPTNMARRVGLSKTNNKFGKQTLYSTHMYLCFCFCYYFLFSDCIHLLPSPNPC